jgi:hypothetical protein
MKAAKPRAQQPELRIRGTGRDGTPACATVPLLAPWALAAR